MSYTISSSQLNETLTCLLLRMKAFIPISPFMFNLLWNGEGFHCRFTGRLSRRYESMHDRTSLNRVDLRQCYRKGIRAGMIKKKIKSSLTAFR